MEQISHHPPVSAFELRGPDGARRPRGERCVPAAESRGGRGGGRAP
jgi:hypothetical protein